MKLTFAPITEPQNQKYAEQIQSVNSVSVHIRRGDFVALNWNSSPEWYKRAIMIAEQKVEKAVYFVFSDELDWCKANRAALGLSEVWERVVFVEGNSSITNFMDMQLMSMCKTNILVGASSFSYLAALLNANNNAMVINASGREVRGYPERGKMSDNRIFKLKGYNVFQASLLILQS